MKVSYLLFLLLVSISTVLSVDDTFTGNDPVTVFGIPGDDDQNELISSVDVNNPGSHEEGWENPTIDKTKEFMENISRMINNFREGCTHRTEVVAPTSVALSRSKEDALYRAVFEFNEKKVKLYAVDRRSSGLANPGENPFEVTCIYGCLCDDNKDNHCSVSQKHCIEENKELDYVLWLYKHNRSNATWKARYVSPQDRRKYKGGGYDEKYDRESFIQMYDWTATLKEANEAIANGKVPSSYDFRQVAPQCGSNKVRNQNPCGTCYAVSASTAFSGRVCALSNYKYTAPLSCQSIVSCKLNKEKTEYLNGCTNPGGFSGSEFARMSGNSIDSPYSPKRAWTKADVTTWDFCHPYTAGKDELCGSSCNNRDAWKPSKISYSANITKTMLEFRTTGAGYERHMPPQYKGGPAMTQTDFDNIWNVCRYKISQGGPVTMRFAVYDNFNSYKSGVYIASGTKDGMHEVAVIGYGRDSGSGLDYWLAFLSYFVVYLLLILVLSLIRMLDCL